MRTLIVFATKHGTTAACANLLAKQLDGERPLPSELCSGQLSAEDLPAFSGHAVHGWRLALQQVHLRSWPRRRKKRSGDSAVPGDSGEFGIAEMNKMTDPIRLLPTSSGKACRCGRQSRVNWSGPDEYSSGELDLAHSPDRNPDQGLNSRSSGG